MQIITDYFHSLRNISLPDSLRNIPLPNLTEQYRIVAIALCTLAAMSCVSFIAYKRYQVKKPVGKTAATAVKTDVVATVKKDLTKVIVESPKKIADNEKARTPKVLEPKPKSERKVVDENKPKTDANKNTKKSAPLNDQAKGAPVKGNVNSNVVRVPTKIVTQPVSKSVPVEQRVLSTNPTAKSLPATNPPGVGFPLSAEDIKQSKATLKTQVSESSAESGTEGTRSMPTYVQKYKTDDSQSDNLSLHLSMSLRNIRRVMQHDSDDE